MPLAMDHKVHHKYPKLLKILLLNTEHGTVHIPRKTIIEEFEVSNISRTTYGTADTTNSPMELPSMPPELSCQPEHNNTKHSIFLQDAQIPQEAKYGLSALLGGDYNSFISKSPTDVGRTHLFQMDSPIMGPPIAHKLYPIPLEYQKFINKEMRVL